MADHADSEESRELRQIKLALIEMFKADSEYGCGFYGYGPWVQSYARLQKMAGYRGATAAFDPDFDDFDKLP